MPVLLNGLFVEVKQPPEAVGTSSDNLFHRHGQLNVVLEVLPVFLTLAV